MAAAMGKDLKMKWNNTLIACLTSNSLSGSRSEISTTCKDSADSETFVLNKATYEFSAEGIADYSSSASVEMLMAAFIAAAADDVSMSTYASGDPIWAATSAYMTSMEITAPDDGVVTWSATFKVNGAITQDVVA